MHLLDPSAYARVIPLCDGLGIHAAVGAVLSGAADGRVYVDDPARPRSALLRVSRRFYLAGAADNARFITDLGALFADEIYPRAREEGWVEYATHYPGEEWERALQVALAGKHPMRSWREHYVLRALRHDWRALLPAGMALRRVDASLLAEERLGRLDDLREEMCSERPSVAAFLARSRGMCVQHRDALVAWCLSEYDHDDRCEIGIETAPGYRRRGLATVTASALVEECQKRGMTGIGWHCWRLNVASGATARHVGLEKDADYPVLFAWFDEVDNLAVNGNFRLASGEPQEALAWFARAFATGKAPSWAYFDAARAAATLGDPDGALRHLDDAVTHGFANPGAIRNAAEFRALHDSAGWRRLMTRLEPNATVS